MLSPVDESFFYLAHNAVVNDVFDRILRAGLATPLLRVVGFLNSTYVDSVLDSRQYCSGCTLRTDFAGDLATSGLPGGGALASVLAKSFFDKSFFGQFIDKVVVDRLRRE